MTLNFKTILAVSVGIVCLAVPAAAQPAPVHVEAEAPVHVEAEAPFKMCLPDLSRCLDLNPGHYVATTQWSLLDAEMKRLQEQEVRLRAENNSFRKSADSVPWTAIAVAVGAGLITGAYIGSKF